MNKSVETTIPVTNTANKKNYVVLLIGFLLLSVQICFGQNKAVVLQDLWNNDLNNYNPKEFVDKLYSLLKDKLSVKDFIADPTTLTASRKDESWDQEIKQQVKAKKITGENAYYIAIASELRLPALNLGKLLFKNPPRSSKLTFTIHIYDSTASEVLGDTIINRGCVVKTVDQSKGGQFFYADYNNFMDDMQCHLEAIRKILQEKPLLKKQKRYLETR